ncbi:hypothetical protein BCR35DRAFT_335344 [Leucosporidium creatinivorum]|uniref:GDP-fucose protein O-fucosyltransferase-domain-containing protein n=1 Tax=Leucosporidium creatinivorum TaxID=106004 RepID=A0A1Y2DCV1_9BASI|nr:hypothetical protein BCR35DRAFT_335344 [Leucosporidium creatinivorum]
MAKVGFGTDFEVPSSSRGRGQRALALFILLGATLMLIKQYYKLSLSSSPASWLSDLPASPFPSSSPSNVEAVSLPSKPDLDISPSHGTSKLNTFCKTRSCSFLFPVRIGEQETKAQQHLYQLGLLARSLDRILVLPRSRKSRFGACLLHPFDHYYEDDALEKLGISTVLQWEWEEWSAKRREREVQLVRFATAKDGMEGMSGMKMGEKEREDAWGKMMCMREQAVSLGDRRIDIQVSTKPWTSPERRDDFARLVMAGLAEEKHQSTLIVDYNLRYPFLAPSIVTSAPAPLPFSFFPLQSHYTKLASSLTSQLGSFIAIHWRIETLPLDRLPACASSLVDHLVQLKRSNPSLSTVYLATDYPIDSLISGRHAGNEAHSGTFTKSLSSGHEKTMRRFLKQFDSAAKEVGLSLTTFAREAEKLGRDVGSDLELLADTANPPSPLQNSTLATLLRDSATSSIVDLLIAQQADVFLAGLPTNARTSTRGCGKASSFTTRIVDARRERGSSAESPKGEEFAVKYFEVETGDVLTPDDQ